MGARMRAFDWSKTPLGPPERWPQSLKTAVRIMLTSRQPIWLGWGEQLIKLYNDPYKSIVGGKHPAALGQPASVVWREIWDQIGPRLESAMLKNEGTYDESLLLIMERNGYPEETYYTFSYSPIPNDQGGPGGIICANTDDTQRIMGERQLALLRDLAAKTVDAHTIDEACLLSAHSLETNPHDLPFAMIYLLDPGNAHASLVGTCGIARGHAAAPEKVAIGRRSIWPFADVIRSHKASVVPHLETIFDSLPTGAWKRPPHQAVVVPIASSGQRGRSGLLVVGLNPFRLFDDHYRRFIDLVSGQIAANIANAQAYEEERRRAEALAELDRAKTLFFSNVSHEFRTPLTLMLGPIEDALSDAKEPLSPAQQERMELLHRNSLRLLKLVNTLLDFSRIEAGRIQASYEPTDLAALTAELASVFRSAVERGGMRLVVDAPPLPQPVYVDREMWEKIVLNLLSNAFKFTFEGEISVRLRWEGDHVTLQVRDTGIGIAEEELPHLFERFYRVKGARARTHEGSGIGLALVQELVRLHGGKIQVESRLNQGTTFTLSIPTGTSHLPSDRISAQRELASTALGAAPYLEEALRWLPSESKPETNWLRDNLGAADIEPPLKNKGSSARILLADDNADMREYVRRLLSQRWTVEAVGDGVAALAIARERPPDLVLTDIMMPELDGFELLRALRADPKTKEIPVIFLSARAGEESRLEGLEAGADDYLVKPFSARELLAHVSARLELAQARREFLSREREAREEAETLNDVSRSMAGELDLQKLVQHVTDAGTKLAGAKFGAFFYNVTNEKGESYLLYTLSGAPREAFDQFSLPRNTPLFDPTFRGEGPIRLADVLADPRYGKNPPHHGMPRGHLAVRSYLAVPVISRSGEVIGGLFFGHPEPGIFTERAERLVVGVAAQAAVAIDNARLFEAVKKAQFEAQTNAERLRGVFNSTSVGVAILTLDARFLEVNAAFSTITGYSAEELKTMDCATFTHPDDCATMQERIGELRSGRIPTFVLEKRYFRKDGRMVWVQNSVSLMRDAEGRPANIIALCQDITERKRAEEALRQKTIEAQEASRIKSEFVSNVSHELRTPLNAIIGYTDLLFEDLQARLSNEDLDYLLGVQKNAQDLLRLVNDVLDLAKIESGKIPVQIERINLADLMQETLLGMQPLFDKKSLDVRFHQAKSLPQIHSDRDKIKQIYVNLLSNAVKFTNKGGITIKMIDLPEKGGVEISIQDTGIGIKPEELPKIFNAFHQADASSTREFGGVGLGLAIVKELIHLLQGEIRVESEYQTGSTFTIFLPYHSKEIVSEADPL